MPKAADKTTVPTAAELQERVLDGIRESQHAVLEATRAWSDATAKLTPALPAVPTPEGVPNPAEIVQSSFDFAEKLLASQREFAQELLAVAPVPPTS